MSVSGLLRVVLAADPAVAVYSAIEPVQVLAPVGVHPLAVAARAQSHQNGGVVLVITATSRDAQELSAAARSIISPQQVAVYPAWETLPHERLSPSTDTVGQRFSVLRHLANEKNPLSVVVAPVRSVIQPQIAGLGHIEPMLVRAGDTIDRQACVEQLIVRGYQRVDVVTRRGELAVRGGIVDVFPPDSEHPVRVELWGDDVDNVRAFSVADQRSLHELPDGLAAMPCRELMLTDEVRERAAVLATHHVELADMFTKISEGIAVPGMESLIPLLLPPSDLELLIDALPAHSSVIVCDPQRVRTRAVEFAATDAEFLAASWAAAADGGNAPIDTGGWTLTDIDTVRQVAEKRGFTWSTLGQIADTDTPDEPIISVASPIPPYRGELPKVFADVRQHIRNKDAVVVVFPAHGPAQRAAEQFAEVDLGARLVPDLHDAPQHGSISVTNGGLTCGFTIPATGDHPGLFVVTETDITTARNRSAAGKDTAMPVRRRAEIDPLQLSPGDYVVHTQHGVGKYVDLIRRNVGGAEREYVVLEYAPSKRNQPGDRLFVPTDSLDVLSRYVGGQAPALHRLGGGDWAKAKGRARKAVKQIANELIRLYSARVSSPGYAYGPDTPWQNELEDAFGYVETPDQLSTIDEVKADMCKPIPMDRIVCGDVGYGKTEIAVRAAFKAVQDGKQVAVLVPTTLLAKQHFTTFSERMEQFPVKIAQMSRFQTDGEIKETIAGLADKTIDIVIGTHRILQPTVRFKDLGLVIVDEEQRFGVEHKEQLKTMRAAVDVLTLSATPIPRTLEMSLTGIREMSTITTPPEDRHPVLTSVAPYNQRQISAAIRRELLRDGQVFYLHNRVASIDKAAAKIKEQVPEARVAVAHGQMSEAALEQVMVGFWEREFDVLVSTTIVESGLDIPNANTLIVERADLFGLSQLHQIRGRVGRGRERAYAYFAYPAETPLTETAHDRLATIAQHSDLGAGMAVAMKDLEIRGAGNLLGGEQSGHIEGVGFDLYVRMVSEAVAELKGEKPEETTEVKIDLPVTAHIPQDYISQEQLRLEVYRKLADIADEERIQVVREEVIDRYGLLPEPVANLFAVAGFRLAVQKLGITEVLMAGKNIKFAPVALPDSAVMRVNRLFSGSQYRHVTSTLIIPQPMTSRIGGQPVTGIPLLEWGHSVLRAITGQGV